MQVLWFVAIVIFTVFALVSDWKYRKLPNVLTVPMFCAGLLFHAANGFLESGSLGAAGGLSFAFKGFAVGFGLLLILWFIGGSGGGDVKFMGALGAWLGGWATLAALIFSGVFAATITVGILSWKVYAGKGGGKQPDKKKIASGRRSLAEAELGWVVPFGVPAALGAWTVLILNLMGYTFQ